MAIKTTVEIPDDLFVAAKRQAARQRTTLRTLIERGLRSELRGTRPKRALILNWNPEAKKER